MILPNANSGNKRSLAEGLNRYVGLEHIEPGNIHIKSWVISRMVRHLRGYFVKDRFYLASGALIRRRQLWLNLKAFVRAISLFVKRLKMLIPELLLFIVQSDRFEHAIKTSAIIISTDKV